MLRITARATGRVQGVGYRYFVIDCARQIGVAGFVRNMPDGSVTIVAEGSDEALGRFITLVRAGGDPIIRVDSLDVARGEPTGEYTGFEVRF